MAAVPRSTSPVSLSTRRSPHDAAPAPFSRTLQSPVSHPAAAPPDAPSPTPTPNRPTLEYRGIPSLASSPCSPASSTQYPRPTPQSSSSQSSALPRASNPLRPPPTTPKPPPYPSSSATPRTVC